MDSVLTVSNYSHAFLVIGFEELLEHLDIANDDGHGGHAPHAAPHTTGRRRRRSPVDALIHIQREALVADAGQPGSWEDDDHDHGHGLLKAAETVR